MKKIRKIIISLLLIFGMFLCIDGVSAKTGLDCSKTLRNGSKSENVVQLQKELNEVMNCGLVVDGKFGPATRTCVLAFQKKYSLSQDAVVGKKTCSKLNSLYLDDSDDEEVVEDNNTSELTLNNKNTLLRGSNGVYVKTLQKMLNKTVHCNLDVDGKFGYKTEWCVKKYQEENSLGIDGKVGSVTRKSLNESIII